MIKEEETKSIIADLVTICHLLESKGKRNLLEGYRCLAEAKKKLPGFLYIKKEDQDKCKEDLSEKNLKKLKSNLEKYADILLMLPVVQGREVKRRREVPIKSVQRLDKGQREKLYEYDPKKDKYYLTMQMVPKLILINSQVYEENTERALTLNDYTELEKRMPEDINFILNIQNEEQQDIVYAIGDSEEGIKVTQIKKECGRTTHLSKLQGKQPELTAVLLSLLEYFIEIEKAEAEQRKYAEQHTDNHLHTIAEQQYVKYFDKNSIKVFDMKNHSDTEKYIQSAFYLRKLQKKHCGSQAHGYEVIPHTRKGHYRTYKSGKSVYVRATVIHKEKYEGILSAHRIN